MIQLTEVGKKLGTFQLQGINIELPAGFIMGLIGPNGSGKTTLLHLLMGLYRQNEGDIRIFGRDYKYSEHEIHEEIGVVLQERLFEDYRTLKENADYYGKYYTNYKPEQMLMYLERFELEPNRKYRGLSKGEELKFQFAFALAHQPKLLLLDEPTGNFDPEFREDFLQELKKFIADGEHSILLATHLTDDLDQLADYIVYLEKGNQLLAMDIETLHDTFRMISGDAYKIRTLPKESVIHLEEGQYGSKALVRHRRRFTYTGLTVTKPTIEELMYYITKRKGTLEL